ncbi:hypothetical protein NMY22_g16511 [Coprinellus aureogranulatus]|nr:hypothetical protein NMY22_g16511 [Coprinellus aureogranulatus]
MDDLRPFSQHLNTNYAPSDDEANIIRNHISDHRAEIAALALKIHDATRALAALQAQQKRHERFVREHTAFVVTDTTRSQRNPFPHLPCLRG